jgi:hypothetical protein
MCVWGGGRLEGRRKVWCCAVAVFVLLWACRWWFVGVTTDFMCVHTCASVHRSRSLYWPEQCIPTLPSLCALRGEMHLCTYVCMFVCMFAPCRYWDDTDLMSKISAKLRNMNVSGPTPSAAADAAAAGKGPAGKGAGKVCGTAYRWRLHGQHMAPMCCQSCSAVTASLHWCLSRLYYFHAACSSCTMINICGNSCTAACHMLLCVS